MRNTLRKIWQIMLFFTFKTRRRAIILFIIGYIGGLLNASWYPPICLILVQLFFMGPTELWSELKIKSNILFFIIVCFCNWADYLGWI